MAEPSKQPASELDLQHDPEEKIMQVIRWALPLTSLLSAIAVGSIYGVGTAILVLAGGALLGVIAILWASVRTLAGDAPITLEEAIALGSPSTVEEQKRAVLQALKDLEYERSMGKISEPDYDELVVRYRTEAKRLLKAVDQDLAPLRARAAEYVEKELGRARSNATKEPATEKKKQLVHPCPSCQTDNDGDAVFCKKCGGKLMGAAKDQQDATV
jgi:rRNA maturation endonuclease Nob1